MKDREFIQLLNLYVDREITADDARRLEIEVASSPERRKVYDQYCRIQKACQLSGTVSQRPCTSMMVRHLTVITGNLM